MQFFLSKFFGFSLIQRISTVFSSAALTTGKNKIFFLLIFNFKFWMKRHTHAVAVTIYVCINFEKSTFKAIKSGFSMSGRMIKRCKNLRNIYFRWFQPSWDDIQKIKTKSITFFRLFYRYFKGMHFIIFFIN